jgi:hypothetical protein
MSQSAAPKPQADADRLDAATDQAIAACGGDVRAALKAMIVANEFLKSEVCELMQAVSHACVEGSKPIPADARLAPGARNMAEVTYYVALPFIASDDGVAAGEPSEINPNAAVMRAEALSRKEGKVGAVAFSRTGDPATSEFSDARVIRKVRRCAGMI